MTTHELKTWPLQFDAVNDNRKKVELRKADRDFMTGDVLVLKEWEPRTGEYTGRQCSRTVTHVLRGEGLFGLAEGYVAMSLRPSIAGESSDGLWHSGGDA